MSQDENTLAPTHYYDTWCSLLKPILLEKDYYPVVESPTTKAYHRDDGKGIVSIDFVLDKDLIILQINRRNAEYVMELYVTENSYRGVYREWGFWKPEYDILFENSEKAVAWFISHLYGETPIVVDMKQSASLAQREGWTTKIPKQVADRDHSPVRKKVITE